MPATSDKQKKFMDAAAHNPAFAKEAGIPVGVAQEYSKASKGKKFTTGSRPDLQKANKPKTDHGKMTLFKEGGAMKDMKQDKAMVKKAVGMHDKQMHGGKKTDMAALKKGGMPKMATKKIQKFGTGGLPPGSPERGGGFSSAPKPGPVKPRMPPGSPITGPMGPPQGGGGVGAVRPRQPGVTPKPFMPQPQAVSPRQPGVAPRPFTPRMAKGGGIETKGKTRGKMVKMKSGGRYC